MSAGRETDAGGPWQAEIRYSTGLAARFQAVRADFNDEGPAGRFRSPARKSFEADALDAGFRS